MVAHQASRLLLLTLAAALSYWILLHVSYEIIRGAYIWQTPAGHAFPYGAMQVVTWFTFINAIGALLAAIPVGISLARWGQGIGRVWVLVAGVAPAVYLVGREFFDFDWFAQSYKVAVGILQFVAIAVAPLLVTRLCASRPLTTRSSGR